MLSISGAHKNFDIPYKIVPYIHQKIKVNHPLPHVGGNGKSYMLAYNFNITAYTRLRLVHFSLLTDMIIIKRPFFVMNARVV